MERDTTSRRSSDFSIARILGHADDAAPLDERITDEEEEDVDVVVDEDEPALSPLEASHQRFEWLHCTRYRPPRLPRTRRKEGAQKRKLGRNPRIPFSSSQVSVLEQRFKQSQYLSSSDVAELANYLNLSETRVKIWFQNRRARERRDRETRQRINSQDVSVELEAAHSISPPLNRLIPRGSLQLISSGQSAFAPVPSHLNLLNISRTHRISPPLQGSPAS